jgi:transcriptional regulator with XRE-family HTH domain
MNTDNQQGEYRRFTLSEIGTMVAKFRESLDMKQITLAFEAHVSERTIQRIEQGEKVDDGTLRRVAKALKLAEDTFVAAHYIPSDDEIMAQAKNVNRNFRMIEIRAFAVARDFDAVIGSHGWLIDDSGCDGVAASQIAELKDSLEDWNCVYDDIPHTERLHACEELLLRIQEIERNGLLARFGTYRTDDDFVIATIIFIKKDPERPCLLTQAMVPRHFARSVVRST